MCYSLSQVLITYIDLIYPTNDRLSMLRDNYYFTCQCQECASKSMVRHRGSAKTQKGNNSIFIPASLKCETFETCFMVRFTVRLVYLLQDKTKLKVRKQSEPIEPEVINNMVRYARKTIGEFRAFKRIKNILCCHLIILCLVQMQ